MTGHEGLMHQIGALPRLAADSIAIDRPNPQGERRGDRPGSKPPPGVDLDRIDLHRGREKPALLARLSACIRLVCEECDRRLLPDLDPEGHESWSGEAQWLIATMAHWTRDTWCLEWITAEVAAITRKLTKAKARTVDYSAMKCPTCGGKITPHTTDVLIVAQCGHCERVIGMAPRLTDEQRQAENASKLRGVRALLASLGVMKS